MAYDKEDVVVMTAMLTEHRNLPGELLINPTKVHFFFKRLRYSRDGGALAGPMNPRRGLL